MDSVVAAAEKLHGDTIRIPGVRRILDRLYAEVAAMCNPLGHESAAFLTRLSVQRDTVGPIDQDMITGRQILQLAQGERERGDSVQPPMVSEDPELGIQSQIEPYTFRLDRSRLVESARRSLLGSRVGDLYHRLHRFF